MPALTSYIQRNAAERTSLGGLDFVLQTATPPQEKGKVDEYISAFDAFYKPLS